jgi:membrane protein implicated in regulation of membrane protease activity
MSQSRAMSLVEALTNVVVGYVLAVATQFAVFPLVGVEIRTRQMLLVGLAFTLVSILRSYVLRRLFDRLTRKEARHAGTQAEA